MLSRHGRKPDVAILVRTLAKWMVTILVLGGGLLAAGCINFSPGVTFDVKLQAGSEQRYTLSEAQAPVENIATSLGFDPSPDNQTIGTLYTLSDSETELLLNVFQLRQDQQVYLIISRHTRLPFGVMLGVSVHDYGTGGSSFKDQSIAKKKVLELLEALREEFGPDRIYLSDWAQQQIQ